MFNTPYFPNLAWFSGHDLLWLNKTGIVLATVEFVEVAEIVGENLDHPR